MSLPQPSAGGAPRLRRGVLAATGLVFSLASLSACAAGGDAETLQVKPDNAATAVGDIKVQNANVIIQPQGDEGPAVVSAKIFNNGPKAQTLDSVTIPETGVTAKLSPARGSGPLSVPAGGALLLGGQGNAAAVIDNGRKAGSAGAAQRVVFAFSDTGNVKLTAFVMPARDEFREFGPSQLPTPPPSVRPSGSALPTGSATPTRTASPGTEDARNGASTGASTPAAGHTTGH